MDYPTDLPLSAVSIAVFEEGMSPEYDITWSFSYELSNFTSGDEIGYCLFLQDASIDLDGGGVGPDLGFTGTYDLASDAEPMSGAVLGIGFDSLGAFGLPITDYGSGDTRDGLSTVLTNGVHVRNGDGSIVSTQSVSAFDLITEGKKTVRARLGNYGRRLTVDYKEAGQEFFTRVLDQDVNLTFTSSTRYRPGVTLVKPLTSANTNGQIIMTGLHVEGNQDAITAEEFTFTPLVPFTNNTAALGPVPQAAPVTEAKARLPFLGMEPDLGCIAGSCGLPISGGNVNYSFYPNSFSYGMSAFIGDYDISWAVETTPHRILFYYDGNVVKDTGYLGHNSYNYGESLRSVFIEAMLSAAPHGTEPTISLAPDGYPYVWDGLAGTETLYKDTDTSRLQVSVYSPLSTSDWEVTVGCPYYTLSCGVEDEYLCGLTQQHETLRQIVFTNL